MKTHFLHFLSKEKVDIFLLPYCETLLWQNALKSAV